MKRLIIIFLTISIRLVGQPSTTDDEVDKYCKEIKSKLDKKELDKFFYPDMSYCGGALYGYYDKNKLVYMDATYGAEFGYIQKTYFIKDSTYLKIIETNYQPADLVDDYCKTHKTNTGECDYKNMPYNKIITTFVFSEEKIVTRLKNNKKVNLKDTTEIIKRLIECGQIMQKQLGEKKISR
jgi:hypothetical protein